MSDVTQLLSKIGAGDPKAADELLSLVYNELRHLAARQMANEPDGHTLQPTALVHEAWLRLAGAEAPRFQNRAHFFAAAGEAMRRILIAGARRRNAQKRGGGSKPLNLDDVEVASQTDDQTLWAVDEALAKLDREDPVAAQLVKLRFFVGLTNAEAAEALGISERTAKRYWTFARAWLFQEIRSTPEV
jgi:RNA polymerase sigma factor (TIGR02999 family)